MSKNRLISFGKIAENRKSRYNYEIREKVQTGIILTGTEVKSLRQSAVSMSVGQKEAATKIIEDWLDEVDEKLDLIIEHLDIDVDKEGE